jgi:putative MATE family efflux protein
MHLSTLAPQRASTRRESTADLLRLVVLMAMPVLAEHALHIATGLNSTYLASHLHRYDGGLLAAEVARADEAAATAAVGTIAYILWFVGLVVSAIGTGSTALIARATGARNRRLSNSVCGQSISLAMLAGIGLGAVMITLAGPLSRLTGLEGDARTYAHDYMRVLAWGMPLMLTMFVANSCLRGAGDTLTPAVVMIVVDALSILFSWVLTYGLLGAPRMGFTGIALGSVIAYSVGGIIQLVVLSRGRAGLRLFVHRLLPHWHTLRRMLRIGVPSGAEGLLQWTANFAIVYLINSMDRSNVSAAAHNIAIRVESLSYMTGFAFAVASSTLVGQSLGMGDPNRARRCVLLALGLGAGAMGVFGLLYILFARPFASLLSADPAVIALTAQVLVITGFVQLPFGGAIVLSGALRGAGDTLAVMVFNLASVLLVRLVSVYVAVVYFNAGLKWVWILLSAELCVRAVLMAGRFLHGGWKTRQV